MEPYRSVVQVGIDIGQAVNPSAVVVAETGGRPSGRKQFVSGAHRNGVYHPPIELDIPETVYTIRYLHRLPLGLSYKEIAHTLAGILTNPMLSGREVRAWIDQTGVGRPVYEQIADIVKERAPTVILYPITFVRGMLFDRAKGHLGKGYMVSHLQAHFQFERLRLPPNSTEAAAIKQEIDEYDISIDQDGTDHYGTQASAGHHFDLVVGLGLATLEDPLEYEVTYSEQRWA